MKDLCVLVSEAVDSFVSGRVCAAERHSYVNPTLSGMSVEDRFEKKVEEADSGTWVYIHVTDTDRILNVLEA